MPPVNGVDLSDASPAEALKVFASAHDPILIEVKRRPSPQSKSIQTDETSSTTSTTSARNALWQTLPSEVLHGLMLQDDDEESYHEPVYQNKDQLLTFVKVLRGERRDGKKAEVVLARNSGKESLGLELTWKNPLPQNEEWEEPGCYISAIYPDGIASKHPTLRLGDQLLQASPLQIRVDGEYVRSLEQAKRLLSGSKRRFHLSILRSNTELKETNVDGSCSSLEWRRSTRSASTGDEPKQSTMELFDSGTGTSYSSTASQDREMEELDRKLASIQESLAATRNWEDPEYAVPWDSAPKASLAKESKDRSIYAYASPCDSRRGMGTSSDYACTNSCPSRRGTGTGTLDVPLRPKSFEDDFNGTYTKLNPMERFKDWTRRSLKTSALPSALKKSNSEKKGVKQKLTFKLEDVGDETRGSVLVPSDKDTDKGHPLPGVHPEYERIKTTRSRSLSVDRRTSDWKVKIRPDGTRYITRRKLNHQILERHHDVHVKTPHQHPEVWVGDVAGVT
ncbi:unnamed protein product [Darwinula stevensoni]|uniref:PDZ domain-containing protein n=1 Tax=Darwinula stevensoni TaxID=69355 RepID=A0A7R9A3C3_9CRUS|nr:unnamed protein product [Darwinula stevensoni]CAG0890416.1 unnamed protein product [Darwinula stevensoni]